MDSFLRYSAIFRDTPAVSRNVCGSNASTLPFDLCLCGFIVRTKRPSDMVVRWPCSPYQEHLAQNCPKEDSATPCLVSKIDGLGGEKGAIGRLPRLGDFPPLDRSAYCGPRRRCFPHLAQPFDVGQVLECSNARKETFRDHFHQREDPLAGERDS